MSHRAKIPVTFLGVDRPGSLPEWALEYGAQATTVGKMVARPRGVSVLQAVGPAQILRNKASYEPLFKRLLEDNAKHFRIVFGFENSQARHEEEIVQILRIVPGIACGIDLAWKKADLQSSLVEAITKLRSTWDEGDSLTNLQTAIEAGRDLRSENGRLNAKKIAAVYGMSQSEIARLTGRSKQALNKTPDALKLQEKLLAFERIAGLRVLFDDEQFRVWLNSPNDHLENGVTPLAFIKAGGVKQLSSLVSNMLTGAPA